MNFSSPSHAMLISASLIQSFQYLVRNANYEAPHYAVFSSFLSHHLSPIILFSTLFSNTLGFCSFLNMKDQVSHLYKTPGKV
jgi:hypothetical protein